MMKEMERVYINIKMETFMKGNGLIVKNKDTELYKWLLEILIVEIGLFIIFFFLFLKFCFIILFYIYVFKYIRLDGKKNGYG